MSIRRRHAMPAACGLLAFASAASLASAQYAFTLIARSSATGTNNFRLPVNATLNDATPDINDSGLVTARVTTDSVTFVQGTFVGTAAAGSVVYRGPADVLVTDGSVNNAGRVVYGVQQGTGLRSFDSTSQVEGLYTLGLPGTNTWESPRIASDGRTVYRATVGGARAIDLYNPASNTTTRLASQNTLDPQSPFNFIFNPSISPNGTVAVKLQRGSNTTADEVWVYPPAGTPVRVAAETGAQNPGLFTSIDNSVNVNDAGKVVIAGTLTGDNIRGIFIVDGVNPPVPVAFQAAGFTVQFFTPDINNAGDVVFRAQSGSTQGIYVGSGSGPAELVAFVNQPVATDQGDTAFSGFLQNPRINELGDVVFGAALQSGGRGIFIASRPQTGCDDIDFNNNSVFPEDQDVIDFFNVLAGASCPACNDIDFNNNQVFPEDQDVIDFFNVLAGGGCP